MSRRRKPRQTTKVVVLPWSPSLAEIFELPIRLGMTPPARVRVTQTPAGRRYTFVGDFRTDQDVPSTVVVRLAARGQDYEVVETQMGFRLSTRPEAHP